MMQNGFEKVPSGGLKNKRKTARMLVCLLAVLLASVPNFLGQGLPETGETAWVYYVWRIPWGVALITAIFLFGRHWYKALPLVFTVFIAFPVLALYALFFAGWSISGFAP